MAILTNIPGLQDALAAFAAGSVDGRPPDANGVRGTFVELPFDREYRVEIVEAKTVVSQAGNDGIRFVVEVIDHPDNLGFVGGKVWGGVYFTGNSFQGLQYATLCKSNNVITDDTEVAAKAIVGGKMIVSLKEGNDPNYPDIRWMNIDLGQKIKKSGVKPPKPAGSSSGSGALTANVVIPAAVQPTGLPGQAQEAAAPAPAPTQEQLPVYVPEQAAPAPAPAQGGIKLPGQ